MGLPDPDSEQPGPDCNLLEDAESESGAPSATQLEHLDRRGPDGDGAEEDGKNGEKETAAAALAMKSAANMAKPGTATAVLE
jgi:hypothetical protein